MAQPVPPPNYYYYPPGYYAPPPKKSSGCLTCLLIALIVGFVGCVLLVAVGIGGYFLWKNNTISEKQILKLVGKAPGEVNIINLADENLQVVLTPLDTSESSGFLMNNELQLEPLDIDGFAVNPGRVQLDFSTTSSGVQSCTLRVNSGDYYQFVATTQGIVVTNEKYPVQSGADLRIATSPLCQP
jgi:hypothetical protein